ncbi:Hypothetical predicted protein [Pelobates cultripes]|uniref:Uncharacterized protein n=1 Tax=Pelobates cultripes TaxID=61616 RepID=A0AAD1RRM6_PELCU|nr:Hypothetical predicted protein [Pelobates cultripes]
MKILLTVFLCGLALCYAEDDKLVACLAKAFQKSPPIATSSIDLFCHYGESPEKDRELLNGINDAWKPVAGELGCGINSIANINADSTLKEVTEEAVRVVGLVLKALEQVGISRTVLDPLCTLLKGLLTSDCLKTLLGENIPDIIKILLCVVKNKTSTLENVTGVMKKIVCAAEDALSLENAAASLTDSAKKILADTLKSKLLQQLETIPGISILPCGTSLFG